MSASSTAGRLVAPATFALAVTAWSCAKQTMIQAPMPMEIQSTVFQKPTYLQQMAQPRRFKSHRTCTAEAHLPPGFKPNVLTYVNVNDTVLKELKGITVYRGVGR